LPRAPQYVRRIRRELRPEKDVAVALFALPFSKRDLAMMPTRAMF
jgi:hypothetical protein